VKVLLGIGKRAFKKKKLWFFNKNKPRVITIPRGRREEEMDFWHIEWLMVILPEDQSCKRRVSWTHQAGYSGNSFSIKLPTVYRGILHLKAKQQEKKKTM
jgi:hypothetical protein